MICPNSIIPNSFEMYWGPSFKATFDGRIISKFPNWTGLAVSVLSISSYKCLRQDKHKNKVNIYKTFRTNEERGKRKHTWSIC